MTKQYQTDVLIAGAGPTGLMLAAELALAGVGAAIIERRPDRGFAGARAGGLSSRTLEILDMRGIVDRFLAEGQVAQVTGFGMTRLDISDFPTRHPYGLGLWQVHIERLLADRVDELGVPVLRNAVITGVDQDDTGVTVTLADGTTRRARFLVGCDGGRSIVRKAAGIAFPGWDATMSSIIAEAEITTPPPLGIHRTPHGTHSFGRVEYKIVDGQIVWGDTGPWRMMVPESELGRTSEPTLDDLREALIAVCGTDYGVHSPTSLSRFTDVTRQAESYRKGRILLAGDAAHIHSPIGGQGLNLGVQDAVNLGWKLAQVVKGISPDALLDTYHTERHPVAARVLRTTMAQVALHRTDDRTDALRDIIAGMLAMEEPRTKIAAMQAQLDIAYDFGPGHPLLGRRMPDLDLVTATGTTRVSTLLHPVRPVLLALGELTFDCEPWSDRLIRIDATCDGPWQLPAIGTVPAPAAVLIRPDGHVAWTGNGDATGLRQALANWFGAPN